MSMMNIVGVKEYINDISKDIVLMGNVDIVNALNEIKSSNFTLNISEENVDELVEMNYIKPINECDNCDDILEKINKLKEIYDDKFTFNINHVNKGYNLKDCVTGLDEIYDELIIYHDKIVRLKNDISEINRFYENFKHVTDLDVDIEELRNLEYFDYSFGILAKEDKLKLRRNYENISAIVIHTGSSSKDDVYLVIYPAELKIETERILRSLNFHNIHIPEELTGKPRDILNQLEETKIKKEEAIEDNSKVLSRLKKKYKDDLDKCYSKVIMKKKVSKVKKHTVSTKHFFYLSGWVSKKDEEKIRKRLEKYKNLIIMFKGEDKRENNFKPPTKLNNIKLFKPFEYLVKMYGVPSYNELDPTAFLSITYMFLFGAMFGDVGQGFVLFILGYILKKTNKSVVIGSILNRLGISSMVFGSLYGSLFGFEHILPALLIKPFENINKVLIGAIIIGVFLLLVSYLYSIINSLKQKDYKEGLFGRNGITGLIFYLTLLFIFVKNFVVTINIPNIALIPVLILGIITMIIKEPLTNIIFNKRPLYHESKSSYYIESSFDILETLLSMLSNTVSFIRVGAFALTHVGLFIAFETIANLIGNNLGSIFMLILGNIIIIGLEGLIVAIQGLRLQYYELFSKYYKGEGKEFEATKL